MSKIGEFTVLPLSIPPTPAFSKPTTHTLYLRPHSPKIPTANDSRSLFLVNVPIDSTSEHLRGVFVSLLGAGRFESVTFEHENQGPGTKAVVKPTPNKNVNKGNKRKRADAVANEEEGSQPLPLIWDRALRRSGSTAVVLLVDAASVAGALRAARKAGQGSRAVVWGAGIGAAADSSLLLGSARYAAHQRLRFPDEAVLQANVDAYMTAFNRAEEARARETKRSRGVVDEDGFVTVVRGAARGGGGVRAEDAERKRGELEEREGKKREELAGGLLGGFYRFQGREKRKSEQGELVRRFEEDRRRVEEMRRTKKGGFRPET